MHSTPIGLVQLQCRVMCQFRCLWRGKGVALFRKIFSFVETFSFLFYLVCTCAALCPLVLKVTSFSKGLFQVALEDCYSDGLLFLNDDKGICSEGSLFQNDKDVILTGECN